MAIYTTKQFSVDSHGAYLVGLTDSEGSPILFERTEIDGKRRGGAHVCLPYFGPDAAGILPQHGFGRDVEWQVEVISDKEVRCTYEELESELYSGLRASLVYKLDDVNLFTTSLTVENRGRLPFPVTPGFHPYFAIHPDDSRLNGAQIDLADFEPFKELPDTPAATVISAGRTITVEAQRLRHMVVWTDMKGDYLCVEPTLAGNAFDSAKSGSHILQPGESVAYSYGISWSTR